MLKAKSNLVKLTLLLGAAVTLQGCVTAAVIGAGAVATKVATDPRTMGTQIDDETLELKVSSAIYRDKQIKEEANVGVVSYAGRVLLIGSVSSEELKNTAESLARGVQGVAEVYNYLYVGKPVTFVQATKDTWITTQVKSRLLVNDASAFSDIKVVTENGVVYMMGLVTEAKGNKAAEIASKVDGVKKVIKAFAYKSE